jgi:adenine-specific DNA-methyltransferase
MKKNDYSDWNKNDLIKEIKKLKKRKKYGIVWDEERTKEIFEKESKDRFPILRDAQSKEIQNNDELTHILIEGDNYHALSVLNYTHKNSIDVIYADPPYNTGSRSWKYNNDFVVKEDTFRHSKWLSYMEKRLRLAKNLLTVSGIIMITIDDYELHTLGLLMDDIFGENNKLGTICIVNKADGRSDDEFIATAHEYMLVYSKNSKKARINELPTSEEEQKKTYRLEDSVSRYQLKPIMSQGVDSRRQDRPNLFYPIFYDPKINKISLTQKSKSFIKLLPIDSKNIERRWSSSPKRIQELTNNDELVCKKSKTNGNYFLYRKVRVKTTTKVKSFWNSPKYNAAAHGTKRLDEILGKNHMFNFPKSLYAVMDALKISSKKDSTILDFFAGSGTTGHAVLELNKMDKGSRKFIMNTNNENNICTEVCHPRLSNIIQGYKNNNGIKIDGLGGNLKYFKTAFVDSEPTDRNKKKLVEQSTEMLCLKEDCFDEVKNSKSFKIFKNFSNKYLGIIFDDDGIEPFKKEVSKFDHKISTYIFSLDESVREEEFENIIHIVDLKPIPEVILNVYRRIFR